MGFTRKSIQDVRGAGERVFLKEANEAGSFWQLKELDFYGSLVHDCGMNGLSPVDKRPNAIAEAEFANALDALLRLRREHGNNFSKLLCAGLGQLSPQGRLNFEAIVAPAIAKVAGIAPSKNGHD